MPDVIGGFIGAKGAKKAAKTQADAARYAADLQMEQFERTKEDMQPYVDLGYANMPMAQEQADLFANQSPFSFTARDFQQSPGYQFAMEQGLRGVNNNLRAKGLGLSGAQMKGGSRFATGLANQDFGNAYNRALSVHQQNLGQNQQALQNYLAFVSGGQNAAAGMGQLGADAASGAGNMMQAAGEASAQGTVASTGAITDSITAMMDKAMMAGMGMGGGIGGFGGGGKGNMANMLGVGGWGSQSKEWKAAPWVNPNTGVTMPQKRPAWGAY